jgi:DNA-binding XRE family transcriptional regulator
MSGCPVPPSVSLRWHRSRPWSIGFISFRPDFFVPLRGKCASAISCCMTRNAPQPTPAQVRAARGLLDWTQPTLAERSGVGVATIRAYEAQQRSPYANTLQAFRDAFSEAGVRFTERGVEISPGAD